MVSNHYAGVLKSNHDRGEVSSWFEIRRGFFEKRSGLSIIGVDANFLNCENAAGGNLPLFGRAMPLDQAERLA